MAGTTGVDQGRTEGSEGTIVSANGKAVLTSQTTLSSDEERFDQNSTDNKQSEQNAKYNTAIQALQANPGNLSPEVVQLLSHFILQTASDQSLSDAVVATSAVSIDSFADPVVNDIDDGTSTFALTQAAHRPPLNGRLREGLRISGGERANWKRVGMFGVQMNAIRAGVRSRLLAFGTSAGGADPTTSIHDAIEIEGNAAGNAGKFVYSLFATGVGSHELDFDLNYIWTNDSRHGQNPDASRAHFNQGDILFGFWKIIRSETDYTGNPAGRRGYSLELQIVRFDSEMNYIETQLYTRTHDRFTHNSQEYIQELVTEVAWDQVILSGGDANGTSDHEYIFFETVQYKASNPVANELHPGSVAVSEGLRHAPSSQVKLLGLERARQSLEINVNLVFKILGDKVVRSAFLDKTPNPAAAVLVLTEAELDEYDEIFVCGADVDNDNAGSIPITLPTAVMKTVSFGNPAARGSENNTGFRLAGGDRATWVHETRTLTLYGTNIKVAMLYNRSGA